MPTNDRDCRRSSSASGPLDCVPEPGELVLVTGDVSGAVHRRGCRQLLDGPRRDYRRLLALPASNPGPGAYLPADAHRDPAHLRVFEFGATTEPSPADRGSDAHGLPAGLGRPDDVARVGGNLRSLGVALMEQVSALESATDELPAGSLHVCIDGVDRLVEDGEETFPLVKFAHLLRSRLREVGGIGSLHIHRRPTDRLVTLLRPLCTPTVDLRGPEDRPEYRVRRTDGENTDWQLLPPESG